MVTIDLIVKSHRSCSCLSDEAACGSMRPGADQRNYSKSHGCRALCTINSGFVYFDQHIDFDGAFFDTAVCRINLKHVSPGRQR
jgi:hypothetical protein